MRRTMALVAATAAWVLLIQVGSIAMAPPPVVQLSSTDVSNDLAVAEPPAVTLAPATPDVVVLSGMAGVTTTTRRDRSPITRPTTTTSPVTTTTTPAPVITTPAPVTTTPAAVATTTTVAVVTTTTRAVTPTTAVPATTTTRAPTTTTQVPTTTTQVPTTTTFAAPPTTVPATTTTVTVAPTTTAAPAAGSFSASAESDFISRINGLRSSVGVGGLAANGTLANYARWWAKQMAVSGNFAHSNIASLLNPWSVVGENIGYGPTVSTVFNALVASPLHYNNMVDARFTAVGVGAYTDSTGRIWTAHIFGG